MLFHSAPLLTVILVDMAALLLYNYAGMCVTGASTLTPCHLFSTPLHITSAHILQKLTSKIPVHANLPCMNTASQAVGALCVQASWELCSGQCWRRCGRCLCGWWTSCFSTHLWALANWANPGACTPSSRPPGVHSCSIVVLPKQCSFSSVACTDPLPSNTIIQQFIASFEVLRS